LERNANFFKLFLDFKGYINFFLLQDLVEEDYAAIKFWSNFDNFETAPLPNNKEEYLSYMSELLRFVKARNQRILSSTFNGVQ
tara:strand:- start:460 stop:708 length:249 start_codon:yes stop_codon:yes gene_type:complete